MRRAKVTSFKMTSLGLVIHRIR